MLPQRLFNLYNIKIIVDGVLTNTEAILEWRPRDMLARNYLIATIESKQQRSLVNFNTAHEMWMRLSAQHLRNAVENQHVTQKFFEYQFNPEHGIISHITEIETVAAQLSDVLVPLTPVQVMTKIICTLPPSYRSFTITWDSVPASERTIGLLTSRLLKEETMARRWNGGRLDAADTAFFANNSYSLKPNPYPPSSLSTNYRGRGLGPRGQKRGQNRRSKPYVVCSACNRPGHRWETGRDRLRRQRNPEESRAPQDPAAAVIDIQEELQNEEEEYNDVQEE